MIETIITPEIMPIAVPLASKIADIFRPELEIRIIWTASEAVERSFLWGLYTYRKGERREIVIRAKQGFCEAMLNQLRAKGDVDFIAGSEFFT
jgi:hypothetical protein